MRRLAMVLAMVATAGCHGPLDVTNDARYSGAPAWLRAPDLSERVSIAVDIAARAWGGAPGDLGGWTMHLVSSELDSCSGHGGLFIAGCTESSILGGGTIRVYPGYAPCIEATLLAHEIGHVIIGDEGHSDARWCDQGFWRSVAETFAATVDGQCRATLLTPGWPFVYGRACG